MSLYLDNPVQPTLDLPPSLSVWQRCEQLSEGEARWRIYLHQLAETALLKWFEQDWFEQDWFESGNEASDVTTVQPWPTAASFDMWHVVEGLALTVGSSRVVVILSEAIDAVELRVPQEWIDLPTWAGDYYLAAQVDVDEQRLSLWGYATHVQLKTEGQYDADSRTYGLSDQQLIEDFSVFQVARQLIPRCRSSLEALPAVPAVQATNLLSRLVSVPDPRLDIPFSLWGALLSDRTWRNAFYQHRQLASQPALKSALKSAVGQTKMRLDSDLDSDSGGQRPLRVNLGAWLNQQFDQDWQTIDHLFPKRSSFRFRAIASDQAVKVRGKSIVLKTATVTLELALILMVTMVSTDRRNIRVLLYPADAPVLAPDIEMALAVEDSKSSSLGTETVLRKVQSGMRDNYIQLPPFVCSADASFSVEISLADSALASSSTKLYFVSS